MSTNASKYGFVTMAAIIGIWLGATVTTVVLNKHIFKILEWKYPITLTITHMIICFIGSTLSLKVFKIVPFTAINSNEYWKAIVPLGLVFSVNIVLGNVSLKYVPVSFMQTVKSSVPFFTVCLERFILGTQQSPLIYASVVPIVGGVSLASWTEVEFDWTGFMAALIGSVVTAWSALLTAKLLQTKLDAINLLYYMTPLAGIFLLPVAMMTEFSGVATDWAKREHGLHLLIILFISSVVALSLNLFTFLLINSSSALTYTILGNVKVIFSISISVLIFRNEVGFISALGCVITLIGAAWYSDIKRKIAQAAKEATMLPTPVTLNQQRELTNSPELPLIAFIPPPNDDSKNK